MKGISWLSDVESGLGSNRCYRGVARGRIGLTTVG
jgi:hypothetical protein